jgi:hypothetical protein
MMISAPNKTLQDHVALLDAYEQNTISDFSEDFWKSIEAEREAAVGAGNEQLATEIWCLEQVALIQQHFRRAFRQIKHDEFYAGWCSFERAEIHLGFLRPYMDWDARFGLNRMAIQIPIFQELFPYKVFLSPGYLIEEARCSICQEVIRLRNACGHEIGRVYGGKMCGRIITKAQMLETSLVYNPVQKYSVAFIDGVRYNYGAIKFVADGLVSPWHGWSYDKRMVKSDEPKFTGVGRNDPCPCGSEKKFKNCCIDTKKEWPHYDVKFEVEPPSGYTARDNVHYYVDEPGFGLAAQGLHG